MANFNVGFVIFPELTQLDFTGPLQVLARLPDSTTHIAAKSMAPVPSDCGLALVPTTTFAGCPPLDLICVPGGAAGVARAMVDAETIAFVRRLSECLAAARLEHDFHVATSRQGADSAPEYAASFVYPPGAGEAE